MKNAIKLFFLGVFLFGITITRAQISTATGGATNVLPNSPSTNTNVGVGTTNPLTKFQIDANPPLRFGTVLSATTPTTLNTGDFYINSGNVYFKGLNVGLGNTNDVGLAGSGMRSITGLGLDAMWGTTLTGNTPNQFTDSSKYGFSSLMQSGFANGNTLAAQGVLNVHSDMYQGAMLSSINPSASQYQQLYFDYYGQLFARGTMATTWKKYVYQGFPTLLVNTVTDNGIDKLQVSGSLVATTIKKLGGTASQFLMADGSVSTPVNAFLPLAGGTLTGNLSMAPGSFIGIGKTVPFYNLDIESTTGSAVIGAKFLATTGVNRGAGLHLDSSTNTATIYLFENNGGNPVNYVDGLYIGARTPGLPLCLTTNNAGTEAKRLMITSVGNVLINSSTDDTVNKLQVTGSMIATTIKKLGGTATQFLMADGTTSTATNTNVLTSTANTMTSIVNGVTANAPVINSVSNTIAGNNLTTTINGVATAAVTLPITTNNIYTNDGALSGARTITMGANPITFSGTGKYIINSGNVGIGSSNPDEKLTVKGKIHAEEIKVDLLVPADYVFQKYYTGKSLLKSDYSMPTLTEVETFTKANHHLPNVPSAQEIQQNGFGLGEMSNVLLQKVEELTLYIIGQNKDIEELKAQVKALLVKK